MYLKLIDGYDFIIHMFLKKNPFQIDMKSPIKCRSCSVRRENLYTLKPICFIKHILI